MSETASLSETCSLEEKPQETVLQDEADGRLLGKRVPSLDLPDSDEVLTDILQSPSPTSRGRKRLLDSVKREYDASARKSHEVISALEDFMTLHNIRSECFGRPVYARQAIRRNR